MSVDSLWAITFWIGVIIFIALKYYSRSKSTKQKITIEPDYAETHRRLHNTRLNEHQNRERVSHNMGLIKTLMNAWKSSSVRGKVLLLVAVLVWISFGLLALMMGLVGANSHGW